MPHSVLSVLGHTTTFEIVANFTFLKCLHILLNIYGKIRKKFLGSVFELPFLLYAVTHSVLSVLDITNIL